jgi:hypothetical protein
MGSHHLPCDGRGDFISDAWLASEFTRRQESVSASLAEQDEVVTTSQIF